jgi:hypothetical protein
MVRRSGESGPMDLLEGFELNKSEVTVWALAHPPERVSARQGNSARKAIARHLRPLAGPAITTKIPQQIHLLRRRTQEAPLKTSLMELKQLWLMGR